MNTEQSIAILNKYFLENISPVVERIIRENDFYFKIAKKRNSKYGDFKPSVNGRSKITVNHDLDKDHFLVTFLHEYAHLKVWNNIKNLQNPHGDLWKMEFYNLIKEFHSYNGFSNDVGEKILKTFKVKNNKIIFSKNKLSEILNGNMSDDMSYLKNLNSNNRFCDSKGNTFEVIEKRRTRFLCRNIKTKKLFLIHGLFKIKTI